MKAICLDKRTANPFFMLKLKYNTVIMSLILVTTGIYAQGTWTNYTKENGLISHRIQTMLEDSKGNLWFGTYRGINVFDGRNWNVYTKENGLSSNNVSILFEDSKGIIWIGTEHGLNKFEKGKTSAISKKDIPTRFRVSTILEDNNGNIWVGIGEPFVNNFGSVHKYDGANWISYNYKKDGWRETAVHRMIMDKYGNIWVISGSTVSIPRGGNVSKFDGSNWTTYDEEDGLPKRKQRFVNEFLEDTKGNIWFGACFYKSSISGAGALLGAIGDLEGSLIKYDGTKWTYYSKDKGLQEDCVSVIHEDTKGNIWVGTTKGISVFDGSGWNYYTENDVLTGNKIIAIKEDTQGNIWIATDNGLTCYDGTNWKKYSSESGTESHQINSIEEDQNGNMWFGTFQGVFKFDRKDWILFTKEDKITGNNIQMIREDLSGNIWIITTNGISKYSP